MRHILAKSIGLFMRYCLFHIFSTLSNGRGSLFGWSICEKIVIASCKDLCDTILVRIHSEVLENCHFHVSTIFLAKAAMGLLELNLKQLHLQLILIECD